MSVWQAGTVDFWWPGAARPARAIALVGAVALMYGTLVHLTQLAAGGWDPYPSLPNWLAVCFVSLTVLDPLAAVLLLRQRQVGLVLACAVLLSDSAANGYANYILDSSPGITTGRIGHAVVTVLAVTFTAAATQLWSTARSQPHGRKASSLR
ncbi:hypothetical protein Kisp01_66830 [Kineosporia sp. NBRC 101677]|uniref:hypothetical protein n=1 Tax=Kineosporia sp. NBRC 101677 TaxID=3032197 RepID=UPI0024A0400B|nr:hypothetical protein [Kineosporia sp. NBRC 101677]GLY19669.1 hypothetical protein Kisp01_66830 [Kineosporia sp. NBRC 101677]